MSKKKFKKKKHDHYVMIILGLGVLSAIPFSGEMFF